MNPTTKDSALAQKYRKIVSDARRNSSSGELNQAFHDFAELLGSREFSTSGPNDQRAILKSIIFWKPAPSRATPAMLEAYSAAQPPLTNLIAGHNEPSDLEMLGVCCEKLGNEDSAREVFTKALVIERQRKPESDLIKALEKRIENL